MDNDKIIKSLQKELKIHARALEIPPGAADTFIDATLKSVQKTFKTKKILTSADITRIVTKELKKYHPDLAYVYKNRDTII